MLIFMESFPHPGRKQGKGILSQKNSLRKSVERSMQVRMRTHAHRHTERFMLQPQETAGCSPNMPGFLQQDIFYIFWVIIPCL